MRKAMLLSILFLAAAVGSAACARQAMMQSPKDPKDESPREESPKKESPKRGVRPEEPVGVLPKNIEEFERELSAGEAQVNQILNQRRAEADKTPLTAPAPRAASGEGKAETKGTADSGAGLAEGNRASPCETSCQALESMRRAANGICRLAEDQGERCGRARQRVEEASSRIKTAGCDCDHEDN